MKDEYINAINNLMKGCNDIALLGLILQLLQKSE